MESRPPPNLSDPAELAAYRAELREVARGLRYGGVGVTLIGAGVALARAKLWPAIPVLVPVVMIVAGRDADDHRDRVRASPIMRGGCAATKDDNRAWCRWPSNSLPARVPGPMS